MSNLIENSCFWKKRFPGGCLPLPLDYIHIYDHYFKHLLWKHCAKCNESQILFGAIFGRREKSLFKFSRTHGQDGCHAHIWWKLLKRNLLKNQKSYDLVTWHTACGTKASQNLNKWWPWVALDLFFWQSQILLPVHFNGENLQTLLMGKSLQLILWQGPIWYPMCLYKENCKEVILMILWQQKYG